MAQAGAHVVVSDVCERSAINVCNQIKDEGGSALVPGITDPRSAV